MLLTLLFLFFLFSFFFLFSLFLPLLLQEWLVDIQQKHTALQAANRMLRIQLASALKGKAKAEELYAGVSRDLTKEKKAGKQVTAALPFDCVLPTTFHLQGSAFPCMSTFSLPLFKRQRLSLRFGAGDL